ncbi:signal peptide peptidase SppA [Shewanella surugensis]|uniref:Signal peptide peptidase SppA n=1 Tax=Shewanella surugensis TaxID=212020 RepID=A0ABT0LDC5_9GAMM|nr:signal peptide peptidase SppA [Shewanella surugensis]MCL1125704.1 signal peptide peptidase SppA [Shewanella surugensis]
MPAKPSFLKKIFCIIWSTVNGIRKLILNLIFFGLLIAVLVGLSSEENVSVEKGAALVLNLSGDIVEQKKPVAPLEAIMNSERENSADKEILLSDVIKVIDNAAEDQNISTLVLNLDHLQGAGLSKLQSIGDALTTFKASGKPIIANANSYEQNQYFLASFADTIYLNPQGQVGIEGLGRYRQYFQSALNKLKIKMNVFRVGTFKSAIEPLIRDDMSPAAKEANMSLLTNLWQSYSQVVASNRHIKPEQLILTPEQYLAQLDKANNDMAKMALNLHWVDSLSTAEDFRLAMVDRVGKANKGDDYKQISFSDYLPIVKSQYQPTEPNKVAIIVAKGTILNGNQPSGEIGGESTSKLLRQARFDNHVKAIVLRVDSPGGSAFASEQIRQEVLAIKAANKPIIVSMGSYAASGGYWISADADYIFATPTTLTGSIGIFGLIPTFKDSLADLGIYTDGVGTSAWAGFSVTRDLTPQFREVIQRNIERGYDNFISIVANGRDMKKPAVDNIAQGRVWTGRQALKLGLVDELGDIQQAVSKAAEMAKLTKYDTKLIEQKLSPQEQIIQDIFATASVYLPHSQTQTHSKVMGALMSKWENMLSTFSSFDDPNGVYLYCDTCNL